MKSGILILLTLLVGILAGRADEKIAMLTAGSEVYSNVTVTSVSATDVYFTYAGGMANVKLKKLSPDWQKHFRFDPDKAKAAELKQANDALARQFAVDGYPTYVLLSADGKELGRQVGYAEGGPSAFITELDGFDKR